MRVLASFVTTSDDLPQHSSSQSPFPSFRIPPPLGSPNGRPSRTYIDAVHISKVERSTIGALGPEAFLWAFLGPRSQEGGLAQQLVDAR